MEPFYYRGDLLSLHHNREKDVELGEVVVFSLDGRDIPIVHRVLEVHRPFLNNTNYDVKILTKGDNNQVNDRGLYLPVEFSTLFSSLFRRSANLEHLCFII